jgi:hypothetical protein
MERAKATPYDETATQSCYGAPKSCELKPVKKFIAGSLIGGRSVNATDQFTGSFSAPLARIPEPSPPNL